jgi:hypothetical protein
LRAQYLQWFDQKNLSSQRPTIFSSGSSAMFNQTVQVDVAETIAKQLYANVNIEALSWAEKSWVNWYLWIGDPSVATGLMSFIMHEVSSFLKCLAVSRILIAFEDRLFWKMYSLDRC